MFVPQLAESAKGARRSDIPAGACIERGERRNVNKDYGECNYRPGQVSRKAFSNLKAIAKKVALRVLPEALLSPETVFIVTT
jgi:hypothetical protein